MDAQEHVRRAIVAELQRQASTSKGGLKIEAGDASTAGIHGRVDLDELAMAVIGALAGGP